jgi:hypothetical protein
MRDIVASVPGNATALVILGLDPRIAGRSVSLDVVHGRDSLRRRATASDPRVEPEDDAGVDAP